MNRKIPTLNIKDLSLLKSNPKKYYMKKLDEDTTLIDEETSTVKHPVTERARNVGATGKKGETYEKDGESYFDVTYRDGTKLTYHAGEEGEKQLDNVNEQLETIRDWDKLPRSQKRRFIENVYDCRDFTMDRWNSMDDLIKDIRKINKENDNGVSDLDYLSCTNGLLQPLYKIDNNLQRITEKYGIE